MRGCWLLCLMAVLVGTLAGCREREAAAPGTTGLRAVVTVAPLKGLIEPLLPPGSTITVLMEPGRSEHGYEFSPSDIATLSQADLVVYIGLHLEGRLEDVLKKQEVSQRQVVNVAETLSIHATDHQTPSDPSNSSDPHLAETASRHDDHHHHHTTDPHLWLDPVLMEEFVGRLGPIIAQACEAKKPLAPPARQELAAAVGAQQTRIRAVDSQWREALTPLHGAAVVTHHDAFSRPAARYGFTIAAVIREFETSEPTAADLAAVVDAIKSQHAQVIFMEPQFSPAAAKKIQDMAGVKLATLDPLGDGDWFALMGRNLATLAANLTPAAALPPRDPNKDTPR